MARRLNLDGDGQGDLGGHGGEQRAVMVYQLESYRYWEQQLGRDDFVPGQFGENFTVTGLPDSDVCIGDRYRIGEAVFEVTQPRVTCYRVGIRMDDPQMPALLVKHHRPGFYLRVIAEGRVDAGQDIVKIGAGPGRMSVAEIDALLYLPEHPREQLARALQISALSPGWQESFRALDRQRTAGGNSGLSAEAAVPPPAWSGFRALRVSEVHRESRSVVSFWLAAADGRPLPAALPGQFVTIRLDPDDLGPALVRNYSLSGPPGGGEYRISVKAEQRGMASQRLQTSLRAGDTLSVAAPRGAFVLTDSARPVVLISAGIGATPVLAMLHALAAAKSSRDVWWIHGARDGADHAFAAEARELLGRLADPRVFICYSRPRDDDRLAVDYSDAGHVDADLLARAGVPADADAYVCGPLPFMTALTAALIDRGLSAASVRTEVFGARDGLSPGISAVAGRRPHLPDGEPGAGPSVTFARTGLSVPWNDRQASLLEFAESCDVPVRWSCRTGVCHTCETALLSGAASYGTEPLEPPAPGSVLICCSRPDGEVVLDL
jgi:ferredoxin-NADP reductase/MOSC domain-containing protein YiiM